MIVFASTCLQELSPPPECTPVKILPRSTPKGSDALTTHWRHVISPDLHFCASTVFQTIGTGAIFHFNRTVGPSIHPVNCQVQVFTPLSAAEEVHTIGMQADFWRDSNGGLAELLTRRLFLLDPGPTEKSRKCHENSPRLILSWPARLYVLNSLEMKKDNDSPSPRHSILSWRATQVLTSTR